MKKIMKLIFGSILAVFALSTGILVALPNNETRDVKATGLETSVLSFVDLKAALENPEVSTVRLGNISKTSYYSDIIMPNGNSQDYAITIVGHKKLVLEGEAHFSALSILGKKTCVGLINVPTRTSLEIVGNGAIYFSPSANDTIFNYTLYNKGSLEIGNDSSNVKIETELSFATYGGAIFQDVSSALLRIKGENTQIISASGNRESNEDKYGINITDGTFYIDDGEFEYNLTNLSTNIPHALRIGKNAYGRIKGGSFEKIVVESPKTINDFLENDYSVWDAKGVETSDTNQYVTIGKTRYGIVQQPFGGETVLGEDFRVNYSFDFVPESVQIKYSDDGNYWYSYQSSDDGDGKVQNNTALIVCPKQVGQPIVKTGRSFRVEGIKNTSYGQISVESNVFYVDWNPFEISFVANGGSGTMESLYISAMGDYQNLPESTFTAPSGKEFGGWNYNGTILQPGQSFAPNKNAVLRAEWKKAKYGFSIEPLSKIVKLSDEDKTATITFDGNFPQDGYIELSQEIELEWVGITHISSEDEYKFVIPAETTPKTLKYKIFAYSGEYGSGTPKASSKEFTVKWTNDGLDTFEVKFLNNDGTDFQKIEVLEGSSFIFPEYSFDDLTGDNVFMSWTDGYNSYDVGDVYDDVANSIDFIPESDSGWTVYLYDENGSEFSDDKIEHCSNKSSLIVPEYPGDVDDGYFFSHWELDDIDYYPGDELIVVFDCELHAVLDTYKYTVRFNANGGTGEMATIYNADVTYKLPSCDFVAPAGHYFDGWAIDSPSGDKGDVNDTLNLTSDVVLYPIWAAYTYNVRYKCNYEGGPADLLLQNIEGGSKISLLSGRAFSAPNGKVFKAWAKNSPSGEQVNELSELTLEDNLDLYAIWEDKLPDPYVISFTSNGGTGSMEDILCQVGGQFKLPKCTFIAPQGKRFSSWLVGSENKNADEFITPTGNMTITAVWEDAPLCTITFDANGGTGVMNGTSVYDSTLYVLPSCSFTAPNGKEFKCWKIGNEEYSAGDSAIINGNTTIVAEWKDAKQSGEETTPSTPESSSNKPGLSGGAIAGIVIGSTLVVGLGGFSVFWFVIKKKSFADLLAIFKKK